MKDLNHYLKLKYPFTLEKDNDGSYFIEYPDLPGCMTCGSTIEEALRMGEDAKRSWIASAISDNDFIPEPKIAEDYPDNFKLRLPKTLYKQLSVNANAEGVSMNQYCLYLLANGVGGMPFDMMLPKYNEETLAAMREARYISNGKIKAKSYTSVKEMIAELDTEDSED